MAAASGPESETVPSVKTEAVDEFTPQEPPTSRAAAEDNVVKSDQDDFKVPEVNDDKKKLDSEPKSEPTTTSKTNLSKDTTVAQPPQIKKTPVLSPAEQLKQAQISIPYKEPIWGGIPPESEKYSFDVLKNGTLIENIELGKKPWIVFGRLPSCDVFMEHPSLSRHHAVVQYRDTAEDGHERGWYLYDLDSTHGTWVNKVKVKPKVYRRLRVGHVVKFGGSSRLHILQGPEEDRGPESELSISELREQAAKLKRETEVLKQAEIDEEEERERQRQKILDARGCSWGMGEDATEESEENPFITASLVPEHEHLYVDDPKKALKGFYEREGCDLPNYQFTEVGFGKHKCVVELPVDGPNGEVLVAEATVSGKKKDAVIACALEACRLLDMHGMLHASKHESKKRKLKNWEDDDFYDSDEDTFLDRTGTIEKKRLFRMKKSGVDVKAETYESLLPKHEEVQKRIAEIELKLEQAKAQAEAAANEEEDALDAYMTAIKAGVMDTKTRLSLKRELLTLRTEEQRLRKLVNLAKPADMPELKKLETGMKKPAVVPGVVPGVRKIGITKGPKRPLPLPVAGHVPTAQDVEEEEEEEEDESTAEVSKRASTSSSSTRPAKDVGDPQSKEKSSGASKASSKTLPQTENSASGDDKREENPAPVLPPAGAVTPKTAKRPEPEKARSPRVKGPATQADAEMSQGPESAGEKSATKASAPELQPQAPTPPAAKKKRKMAVPQKVEYDAENPNYAMWMPPQNQSGDGRTSLNDKLGY